MIMDNVRIISYEIKHCNSMCIHFYYNYFDNENIWCDKLNKKIYECDDFPRWSGDFKERPFPKECPLPKKVINWEEE